MRLYFHISRLSAWQVANPSVDALIPKYTSRNNTIAVTQYIRATISLDGNASVFPSKEKDREMEESEINSGVDCLQPNLLSWNSFIFPNILNSLCGNNRIFCNWFLYFLAVSRVRAHFSTHSYCFFQFRVFEKNLYENLFFYIVLPNCMPC